MNLPDGTLERYTEPAGGRYAREEVLRPGDAVPLMIGGTVVGEIAVGDLLPPG